MKGRRKIWTRSFSSFFVACIGILCIALVIHQKSIHNAEDQKQVYIMALGIARIKFFALYIK